MKPGDKCHYVSPFRTGTYPAVIVAVHPDGLVDIDTWIPGIDILGGEIHGTEQHPLRLRKLRFGERVQPR